MKIYNKDGRQFRLAGSEQRFEVYYMTIYWLDTEIYQEFLTDELEPYLDPTPQQIAALEKLEKAKAKLSEGKPVEPVKATPKRKATIKTDSKLQGNLF